MELAFRIARDRRWPRDEVGCQPAVRATPEPADSAESPSLDNQDAEGPASPASRPLDHQDANSPALPELPETPEPPPQVRAHIIGPAIRIWLRYWVPLLALSAIALAPVIVLALRAPVPVDQAGGKAALALGWELVALGWPCQLVLVGAATAITGVPPSQLGAFRAGLVRLGRAIVPCVVAAAAIATASLALVVPGLVLLVLLALTGASSERGVPASLVDSVAIARKHLPTVALAVAGMIALDVAIGVIAQQSFVTIPIPRLPSPAQLTAFRSFTRVVALALVVVSPLPATVLAMIRRRAG
jgi:hypothetical protein